jgi:hypothetical protein
VHFLAARLTLFIAGVDKIFPYDFSGNAKFVFTSKKCNFCRWHAIASIGLISAVVESLASLHFLVVFQAEQSMPWTGGNCHI